MSHFFGERIRAAYQHACLKHILGERMSNTSLRVRMGIAQPNYSIVSRIIRDAVRASLLKPYGATGTGKVLLTYSKDGEPGPVCQLLRKKLEQTIKGKHAKSSLWLTEIPV